ncbi:MAG: hypothetical protein IKM59_08260 [Oscillospiraceae bacterium]|nr:hypothetical protein [Oscillospiraceae bacterium]
MSQKLVSENDVKKALGIKDFRNISKDKIMEFVSLIPNMDKEVVLSIINQFPVYKDFAVCAIKTLTDMSDAALEKNDSSHKETIGAYRKILDDLGEVLKKDNITSEERDSISDKMITIADKIAAKDTENKGFIVDILKYGASIIGGALVIGATILGVTTKGKDIPTLKK